MRNRIEFSDNLSLNGWRHKDRREKIAEILGEIGDIVGNDGSLPVITVTGVYSSMRDTRIAFSNPESCKLKLTAGGEVSINPLNQLFGRETAIVYHRPGQTDKKHSNKSRTYRFYIEGTS